MMAYWPAALFCHLQVQYIVQSVYRADQLQMQEDADTKSREYNQDRDTCPTQVYQKYRRYMTVMLKLVRVPKVKFIHLKYLVQFEF